MTASPTTTASPLDVPLPEAWRGLPFISETRRLFRYVRDHDFDALAALCDDDFGIVDLGTEGQSVLVTTRAEWEEWFRSLFARLSAMGAETDTEIESYEALVRSELGYSVVRFVQTLTLGGRTARFDCIATIIWKRDGDRWVESRWHASLLGREIPDGFGEPA